MFLKKMGIFRPKHRSLDSGQGLYDNIHEFLFSPTRTSFHEYTSSPSPSLDPGQELYENLPEFSISEAPDETPNPALEGSEAPHPTPDGSEGEYEDAMDEEDEEDGNTDYNSCVDGISEAGSFNLGRGGGVDRSKRMKRRSNKMMRMNSLGRNNLLAALRKAMLIPCSVGRDGGSIILPKSPSRRLDIGWPTDLCHVSHGTVNQSFRSSPKYDPPPEVGGGSRSVFGVPAQWMQCTLDNRGNCVPTALLMMRDRLYSEGGLQAEGIFRISAENGEDGCVRENLSRGVLPDNVDVHCLAGLIKAWFRELPNGVLDGLAPEQVARCSTEEDCTQLVKTLALTERALLDWAVNLMADVVVHEEHNKMNPRNIAMVFAPNMTRVEDPVIALKHVVQVINLLKTLINMTIRERKQ